MRKLAVALAAATGGVLVVMIAVTIVTGANQEAHEHYQVPLEYAKGLLEKPGPLRLVFALDVAFLVLYTAFFAAFAEHLRKLGAPFVRLALGAMIATAMLDVLEDHHILTLLARAEAGHALDDSSIALKAVISSCKFTLSYLSLVLFGLGIPRTTKLGWVLAAFLVIGTLVTAVVDYAAPPEWRHQLDGGRGVGFLVGFGLAVAWLRSAASAPYAVDSAA